MAEYKELFINIDLTPQAILKEFWSNFNFFQVEKPITSQPKDNWCNFTKWLE